MVFKTWTLEMEGRKIAAFEIHVTKQWISDRRFE